MAISPHDTPAMLDVLRKGREHLIAMAKGMDAWLDPTVTDPVKLHNMYARSLVSCYVSKFADLSGGILHAVDTDQFLLYGLCGRSLLETTANLRYYVLSEYKPLFDRGAAGLGTPEDMQRILAIDDRHLRGTRFDWQSLFNGCYAKLTDDVVSHLKNKKKADRGNTATAQEKAPQINVLTCMEHWAKETPVALVSYNLFCDLVHPNIGSTFLVSSKTDSRYYFSRFAGTPVGREIFDCSFPLLMALTHKTFADHLYLLMATIFPEPDTVGA